MIKYKLTDQNMQTHGRFQWQLCEKRVIKVPGNTLCSSQVFHGYHSPEQAVLFNPIHANIVNPKLWKVEIDSVCVDDGLKFGSKEMTILEELSLPSFTTEERVLFAIYCAKPFVRNEYWLKWAENWIHGSDRTRSSAECATWAAAQAAARAAWAAEEAAECATWSAARAAARAAEEAAECATWSARGTRNFQSIIETIIRERK